MLVGAHDNYLRVTGCPCCEWQSLCLKPLQGKTSAGSYGHGYLLGGVVKSGSPHIYTGDDGRYESNDDDRKHLNGMVCKGKTGSLFWTYAKECHGKNTPGLP